MRHVISALLLLGISACLGPEQSISNYKTSCMVDSECVAVFAGNVCKEFCFCPNAAISSSDATRYASDHSSILAACGPRPALACAADCASSVPHCVSNVCQLH